MEEVEVGEDVGLGERGGPISPMILSPDQSHAAEDISEDEEPSQSNRSFREDGIGSMENEDYSDGEVKDRDEPQSSEVSNASEIESVGRSDDDRHDKSDEDDRMSAEEGDFDSRNEGEIMDETVDSDVNDNVDDGNDNVDDNVDNINNEGHNADHNSDFEVHCADDEIIQTSCGEGVSSTSGVPVGEGNSNFSTDSEADRVEYFGEEDSCNVSSGNGTKTKRSKFQCEEEFLPANFPEHTYGYERGHVESTTDLESCDKDVDYSVDDNSDRDENEASQGEWKPSRGDEDQGHEVSSQDTDLKKEGRKTDENTSDMSEESSDSRQSDDNEEIISQNEKVTKVSENSYHSSSSIRSKVHSHGKQEDSFEGIFSDVTGKEDKEGIDKSAEDSFILDDKEMQQDNKKNTGKESMGLGPEQRDGWHTYTRKKYDSESDGEVLGMDEREEAEDLDAEDGETKANSGKSKGRREKRHDEREVVDEGSSLEDVKNQNDHKADTDDGEDMSDGKDGDDDLEAVSEDEEEVDEKDEEERVDDEEDDREIDEKEKKGLHAAYIDENEPEEGERRDDDEKNIGGNHLSEEESEKETEEKGLDEEEKRHEIGHDRCKSGGHASAKLKARISGKKEKLYKRNPDELAQDTRVRRRKKAGERDWQGTDRSEHTHIHEGHDKADDKHIKTHTSKHKMTWDKSPHDGGAGDKGQEFGREKRVATDKLVTQTSLSEEHIELDYEEEMEGHDGTKEKLDDSKEEEEGAIKDGLSSDGELEDDEDCEEGEIREPGTRKPSVKPICRFYLRGHCTWGINCRFIHPGVNDKGNYQLIERPGFNNIHGIGPRGPYGPDGPWPDSPEEIEPPPPVPQPKAETAWERGLRQAKEVLKKATQRKEHEPNFEEKKFNLSLEEDREQNKENKKEPVRSKEYNYERESDDEYYDKTPIRQMQKRQQQVEPVWYPNDVQYENFEVRAAVNDYIPPSHLPPSPFRERERYTPRPRHYSPQPQYENYPRFKENRREKWRDDRQPVQPQTNSPQRIRADEWNDPWSRQKLPKSPREKRSRSSGRRRSRRSQRSKSYSSSHSSSSYSGSSRSRSRSSSYSSYSSRSQSKSSSYSSRSSISPSPTPSPSKRRRPPPPGHPIERRLYPSVRQQEPPRSAVGYRGHPPPRSPEMRRPEPPPPRLPPGPKAPPRPLPSHQPDMAGRDRRMERGPPPRKPVPPEMKRIEIMPVKDGKMVEDRPSRPNRSKSHSSSGSSRSRSRSRSHSSSSSFSHSTSGSSASSQSRSSSTSSSGSADSEHLYRNIGGGNPKARSASLSPSRRSKGKPRPKGPLVKAIPPGGIPRGDSKGGKPAGRQEPPTPPVIQAKPKDPLKAVGQKSNIKLTLISKPADKSAPGVASQVPSRKRPAEPSPVAPLAKRPPVAVQPTKPVVDKVGRKPEREEAPASPTKVVQRPPPAPVKVPVKPSAAPISGTSVAQAQKAKKSTSSRREELLKQLRAVEDAIARKRSKMS